MRARSKATANIDAASAFASAACLERVVVPPNAVTAPSVTTTARPDSVTEMLFMTRSLVVDEAPIVTVP